MAMYSIEHHTTGTWTETYEPPGEPGVTRSRQHGNPNVAAVVDDAGLKDLLKGLELRDGETLRIGRDDSLT